MTTRMIIGLGYKAGAGKDTVAQILREEYGFVRVGFADTVKDACKAIFSFSEEQLYHPKWKNEEDTRWGFSPRYAMQALGEAMRNRVDKEVWIKALFQKIAKEYPTDNIVIPDVRYPNEAAAIIRKGGFVVRIDRPVPWPILTGEAAKHESETSLDDYADWDATIQNDGSIAALKIKTADMLATLPIVKAMM